MRIKLIPIRMDRTVVISKAGDKLVVDGEVFDFTFMKLGDTLPHGSVTSEWIVGDIRKTTEGLCLNLVLPLPANASQAQCFPADLVNVPDGLVQFPLPDPLPSVLEFPQ